MLHANVAILESNEQFAQELKQFFAENTDLNVCGVSDDGIAGVDMIQNINPDVILLSLILKGIDGFTVLDKLRESGKKYSVIVMGNFANEEIVSTAMSKGAKYYLIKPFAPEVAAARIMELLKNDYSAAGKNISIREKKSTASLDEKISNIFISIGIPPHIKGYNYLREGIKYAVAEPNIINNVTKELYPKIANHFDTTPSKVERAIRHAIEVAWNRGRIDAINAIFGVRVYIGTEKPTNSEFIALVADKLILEGIVNA